MVTAELNETPITEEVSNNTEIHTSVEPLKEDVIYDANQEDELSLESSEEDIQEGATLTVDQLQGKTEQEILAIFVDLVASKDVQNIRGDVELIKIAFYKSRRAAIESARKSYVEGNGSDEGFVFDGAELETQFKAIYADYRSKRDLYNAKLEEQKEQNYREKLAIIEELKELLNSSETLNQTFVTFKELQERWKESGNVSKNHVKELWESYHIQVENFYNFVKINKELRDLDLKKNLEAKISICESAEALLEEGSVVLMFQSLQKLHDQWREIGPVALEFKEQLWERFKSVSTKINKAHQDHFDAIKQEQLKNLELKSELCIQVENMLLVERTTRKEWDESSDKLIEIQSVWKTLGYAPKKDNNAIYARFREACDKFFSKKSEYYAEYKNELQNNLESKTLLCVQAEAILESGEWKKGTEELIALQKQWKEIGAVPRKSSDALWKRFREACDKFFEKKSSYYTGLDSKYEDNLAKKQQIIESLKSFEIGEHADSFEKLKAIQKEWTAIGFVPMKFKESVNTEYRTLIDALFAQLHNKGKERKITRFKEKIKEGGGVSVDRERERLLRKIEAINNDIKLWENNIGFFSNSKNAQSLIDSVNAKIAKANEDIALIKEQIKILDTQES